MDYRFIGWCNSGGHDKVWGVISLEEGKLPGGGGKVLIFWGRRGAKLQTKVDYDGNKLSRLIDTKCGRGYKEIDRSKLNTVYPGFQDDLEKTAVWSVLLN